MKSRDDILVDKLIREFDSCYFLKSYKPLMTHGKPREDCDEWDGLHLSPQGSKIVQRFLMSHLVPAIKNVNKVHIHKSKH